MHRVPALPALLALAGLAGLAALQDPHDKPVRAADLPGRPFAAAIEFLGPPRRGVGTAELVRWIWDDSAGGRITLAMHAGIVVHVDETMSRGAVERRPVPTTGAYPGQPVAELLTRLGPPQRVAVATGRPAPGPGDSGQFADAVFAYRDQRLLVSAGFVLGQQPPEPVPRGPR
ncbi:MAG: hypothetical protein JNK78_16530 [Planctomycetes bacterium]|nr:hypothetical protein [Planctomycetota bacterium]